MAPTIVDLLPPYNIKKFPNPIQHKIYPNILSQQSIFEHILSTNSNSTKL